MSKPRTTHTAITTVYRPGDRVRLRVGTQPVARYVRDNGDGTATLRIKGGEETIASVLAFNYEPSKRSIAYRKAKVRRWNDAQMKDDHEINERVGKYVPGIREFTQGQFVGLQA